MISDVVKTTTAQVIAQNSDLLDKCINEEDERPLMTIVSAVMASLNPQNQWKGDQRVGDPVGIKELCKEALEKRRAEKSGRSIDQNE